MTADPAPGRAVTSRSRVAVRAALSTTSHGNESGRLVTGAEAADVLSATGSAAGRAAAAGREPEQPNTSAHTSISAVGRENRCAIIDVLGLLMSVISTRGARRASSNLAQWNLTRHTGDPTDCVPTHVSEAGNRWLGATLLRCIKCRPSEYCCVAGSGQAGGLQRCVTNSDRFAWSAGK